MASFRLLPFFFALAGMGWTTVMAEDAAVMSEEVSGMIREPRSPSHQKKLCRKYGICQGYGGFQGGYQGYQGGYQNYGQQGYPPINIAISQSQSSANHGGDGYAQGYYPNNYQYNGGYPDHGYNQGHGGHGGYGGYGGHGAYQKPGYFGNGQGGYNNQFNGNYHGGHPNGGGYGFQGGFYDEAENDEVQKPEQDDHNLHNGFGGYNGHHEGRSNGGVQNDGNHAVAGAFAAAGSSR